MKRFLKKFLFIGISSILFISAFIVLSPKNNNHSLASLIDKHKYLEEAKENKMILVGGSNIAMGIDSNMLEKEFNYDVINMGINAGLGLRFMLNDAKQYLEEGDVVIIAPEYSQFTWALNGESVLNIMLKEVPKSINSIDINHLATLLANTPEFLRNRIAVTIKGNNDLETEYGRSAYDSNGDMVSHLGKKSKSVNPVNAKMGDIDQEAIKCLNKFYEYATEKGVKVYLSYPVLFDQQYNVWKNDIANLDKVLKNNCNIPIISLPSEYIYNKNEIYDTIYHVNEEGRYKRTTQLVKDLRNTDI